MAGGLLGTLVNLKTPGHETMRIALIGAYGQLGSQLQTALRGEVVALGHAEIDIAEIEQVESVLDRTAPEIVINTAAYNLVDRAEDEPEAAYRVNALGPRNLAIWCGRCDVPLVHVSTDYVFSGRMQEPECETMRPYREEDCPEPLGAYGVSKLAGEWYVRQHCRRHYVVRTCGLYGRSAAGGKGNFVQTMLRLGRERRTVKVVDDQQCTPTSTVDLAEAITALIETETGRPVREPSGVAGVERSEPPDRQPPGGRVAPPRPPVRYGLVHATNDGSTTWFGFAREIFRLAELDVELQPITSAEFGAKSPRPSYSVLDIGKLTAMIGTRLRPWQEALAEYLAESTP